MNNGIEGAAKAMGREAAIDWTHRIRLIVDNTRDTEERDRLKALVVLIERTIGTMPRQDERMPAKDHAGMVAEQIQDGLTHALERHAYCMAVLLHGEQTQEAHVVQAMLATLHESIRIMRERDTQ